MDNVESSGQSALASSSSKPSTCPYSGSPTNPSEHTHPTNKAPTPTNPTWADIAPLFQAPYWIPADQRDGIAAGWNGCMREQGLDLSSYLDVSTQASLIYNVLQSEDMPQTSDPTQYFPAAALAIIAKWIKNKCPQ